MRTNCPFCHQIVEMEANKCSYCGTSFIGIEYFFRGMTDIFSFSDGCVFNQYMEENYSASDIPSLWLGILSCGLLKLVDESLKFSKDDIIAKYKECKDDSDFENILLDVAKYPNGENLGFYNFSTYDIETIGTFYEGKEESEDKNEIYFMVLEYLSSFDSKISEILDGLRIYDVVTFLHKEGILYDMFWNLAHYTLDFRIFHNSKNLSKAYYQFLEEFLKLKDDDFNKSYMNKIPSEMEYDISIYPFLAKILISRTDLSHMNQISIYDPNFKEGLLIKDVKNLINKGNFDMEIKTYANDDISLFKTLNYSKTLFDKRFNYDYGKTKSYKYKHSSSNFDFIIADLNNYDDFKLFQFDLLREFTYKVENKTKFVLKFNSNLLNNLFPALDCLVNNDYLEALILLPYYKEKSSDVILVINTDKEEISKDKFLLIDEFNNKTNISKDIELQKRILNSYTNFEEYSNSKIILNSSVFINGINFSPIYWELDDDNNYFYVDNNSYDEMEEMYNKSLMTYNIYHDYASEKIYEKFNQFIQKSKIKEKMEENSEDEIKYKKLYNEFILLNGYKNNSEFYADSFTIDSYENHFNFHNLVYDIHRGFKFDYENIRFLGEFCEIFDFNRFISYMKLNKLEYKVKKYIKSLFVSKTKPQLGRKQVFYSWELEEGLEEYNYIELVLMDNEISIDYLYNYLNSDRGIKELAYFSRGEDELNPVSLNYLRIPIPNLREQGEIVEAVAKSAEFFKSIDILKTKFSNNILNYKDILDDIAEFEGEMIPYDDNVEMRSSWEHVYGELLWPLAITYLSATKGSFEITEKFDKYLVLFEFVTAFIVILLMSGIPKEVYDRYKKEIWGDYTYFYNGVAFGSWYVLLERLVNIYKNETFSTELNKEFFLKISNDKILNILDKKVQIRNKYSHGALKNKFKAEKLIKEMNPDLFDLFDILSSLSGLKLYYNTGIMKKDSSNNQFIHDVITLNGPCAQPLYKKFPYNEPLDEESLYLYDKYNNTVLKLKSNLIKFISTNIEDDEWRLFIFNGTVRNKKTGNYEAKYKCFQKEEDEEYFEIDSFKKDIVS